VKGFFIILLILFPFFMCNGQDRIVIYHSGEKDQTAWNMFRKDFQGKGYKMYIYESTDSLDKHLENVNKINRVNDAIFIALDVATGEKNHVFVAVTEAHKGQGNIMTIEEVPAIHLKASQELANYIALSFNKKVKQMPLFPLLGVDMPGCFLHIEAPQEKLNEMFDILHNAIQKYFRRGVKNET